MSDMVDDELLGGEDELDDVYDITQEREDDLLQDEDDEYPKGRREFYKSKKDSDVESEDLSDVLNLDIEEDLQDEDKLLYDEEEEPPKKKDKMTVENTQHNVKPVTQIPKTVTVDKNQGSAMNKFNTDSQKGNNFKKNNWKKRGNGRGGFQQRANFPNNNTNNNMPRRRNGTVLINPRYEGTVHVTENNARLKWDSPQYPHNPQNSYVPPWNSGNLVGTNCDVNLQNQLLSVVSGIANSLVQTPTNLLTPPPPHVQNFYEPSRTTNYEQPLAFEPPPSIAEERHSQLAYGGVQSQVSSQQLHPPGPPPFSNKSQHQPYNNQMSASRRVGNQPYNSYNNYNNYSHSNAQQHNVGPNKVLNRTNSYENRYDNTNSSHYNDSYTGQNNFQNTSVSYANTDYQNRNSTYSDYNTNQGNYTNNKFSYKTNRNDGNQGNNQNVNYRQNSQQNQQFNFKRTITNNVPQQNVIRNDSTRPSAFVQVQSNAHIPNKNFNKQANRRATVDDRSEMKDLSDRWARFNQDGKGSINNDKEEKKTNEKPTEPAKQNTVVKSAVEEEEDEETRQYRLKIEEQKRERERILAIKEERRRQMLLEKQKHDTEKLPELQTTKPNQPKNTNKPPLFTKKHKLEQASGAVPAQTVNQVQNLNSVQKPNQFSTPAPPRDFNQHAAAVAFPREFYRETQVAPSSSSLDIPNMTFKISNDVQSDAPKSEASSSSFMSNRVVVVKGKGAQASGVVSSSNMSVTASAAAAAKNAASAEVGEGVSSFFNSRKVLKKDNNLLNTRLVVVNNLSANINQSKLVALSRGIGEIQNLHVDNRERQATILFKSVASAHAFFTKYQRRILDDLSVIEVTLQPML